MSNKHAYVHIYIQFSSVAQSCLTLCNPMNPSMPGLTVHHQLPEFAQVHVHPTILSSATLFSFARVVEHEVVVANRKFG